MLQLLKDYASWNAETLYMTYIYVENTDKKIRSPDFLFVYRILSVFTGQKCVYRI